MNTATAPACSLQPSFDAARLREELDHHLLTLLGRDPGRAGRRDYFIALAYAVRDVLIERWIETQRSYYDKHEKRVYYLSLEFLIGRSLVNSLINMGIYDTALAVLRERGFELDEIREEEVEAALGNGGLGRLAACFLDSMATLGIPAYGYGIRYEYGLFFQRIVDGYQVESPDNWLRYSSPWEFERPQYLFPVRFCGKVESWTDEWGRYRSRWVDTEEVMAMACDYLVPGFNSNHVINMRLWTARATRDFDLSWFNRGDYIGALHSKVYSETISKVLYPSDDIREGQELRLKQQYFFVAATLQDILRRYQKKHLTFDTLPDKVAIHLNDTHPVIAIVELMRLLLDEQGMEWEPAWDVTVRCFAYTNHTLMPEALETWPVELMARLLPRHMEIIFEINRRFLDEVQKRFPGEPDKIARMSLIEEGTVKKVRMAHLAIVGSHSVNGVAQLHGRLMRERIFIDFDLFFPGKFSAVTNGITPRRWLYKANPDLAALIGQAIGSQWVGDLDRLRELAPFAGDAAFREEWRSVKEKNKNRLADCILKHCGVTVDPRSLFDVHVKRIHEYKRQLLNILQVVIRYQRLKIHKKQGMQPRTVIFAGKAAPSYVKAKLIIKLINGVAGVVNHDPDTKDLLRVVFLPNYSVALAERIIPAAELSEQISTAGTEASGTGNMKLALNGALTIGTLDGANIEIMEEVGRENMFIFGMNSEEAEKERCQPTRLPQEIYRESETVRAAVDAIASGLFCRENPGLFTPLVASLLSPRDPYLVLADLDSYLASQEEVDARYAVREEWTRQSILTVSRMGRFSSDRTIREYAGDIWGIPLD